MLADPLTRSGAGPPSSAGQAMDAGRCRASHSFNTRDATDPSVMPDRVSKVFHSNVILCLGTQSFGATRAYGKARDCSVSR